MKSTYTKSIAHTQDLMSRPTLRASVMALALLAGSCSLVGCRSLGPKQIPESGIGHQARKGEQVRMFVYELSKGTEAGTRALPVAAAALAASVIDKGISFLTQEIQTHMEREEALHEVTYGVTGAGTLSFQPGAKYLVVIERTASVAMLAPAVTKDQKDASGNDTKPLAMRAWFTLESADGGSAIVVRPYRTAGDGTTKVDWLEVRHAAARVESTDDPIDMEIRLDFDAPKLPESQAEDGKADDQPKTQSLGSIVFKRSVQLGLAGEALGPLSRPGGNQSEKFTEALGVAILPTREGTAVQNALMQLKVTITEKDPSKAVARSKNLRKAIGDLNGDIVKALQELAGVEKKKE